MDVQVFVPELKGDEPKFIPLEVPFLGGWENGFRLSHPESMLIEFSDINLLTLFTSHPKEGGRHLLAFFFTGQDQPLMIELSKIQFTDFPGIPDQTPALTCRKFVYHVCKNAGKIFVDRGTYAFLKGQAPQKLNLPIQAHVTFCGQRITDLEPKPEAESLELDQELPEGAEAGNNLMTCPNCGHQQPVQPECFQCGIIIEKFQKKRGRPEASDGDDSPDSGAYPAPARRQEPELEIEPVPHTGGPVPSEFGLGEAFISIDSVLVAVGRLVLPEAMNLFLLTVPPLIVMIAVYAGLAVLGPTQPGVGLLVWAFLLGVLGTAFYSFQLLCLNHYFDAVTEEEPHSVSSAYGQGINLIMSVLPSRLLASLLTLLGCLCFVLPGLVYFARFCFIEPIVAIKNGSSEFVSPAQMSRNLMERYGLSVLGTLFTAYALVYVCVYAVILPFVLFDPMRSFMVGLIGGNALVIGIGSAVVMIVLVAAFTIFHAAVLYVMTKELMTIKGDDMEQGREGFSNLTVAVLAIDAVIILWVLLKSIGGL